MMKTFVGLQLMQYGDPYESLWINCDRKKDNTI